MTSPPRDIADEYNMYEFVRDYIDANRFDRVKYMIDKNGYNTDYSFEECPCFYTDVLYRAFRNNNLDIYKILLEVTKDKNLERACKDICRYPGKYSGIPFLKLFRERMDIDPRWMIDYMEGDYFNIIEYKEVEDFLQENSSIDYSYFEIRLTNKNKEFYKDLIENNKIDIDVAMENFIKQIFDVGEEPWNICAIDDVDLTNYIKLCIEKGSNTSACIHIYACPGFPIRTYHGDGEVMVSLDQLSLMDFDLCDFKYCKESVLYSICNYNSVVHDNATIIQKVYRIYRSKKRTNTLRSNPRNLFCPEFNKRRKLILGIDDSKFS